MNVMGSENRRPTAGELQKMRALIARCMEEGAKGLSFGLIYPPGSYAETEELAELAKEVAAHDGLVMVHTRNEMGRLVEAFEEMLAVMRQSGVRMHISHLKAMGWQNWESKIHTVLGLIEEHQRQGFDLTFDQYPYAATCTGLKVCVPGWAFAGGEEAFQKRLRDPEIYPGILGATQSELTARGGGNNVGIAAVATAEYAWMAGLRLDEVAERLGLEEAEAALHILEHEGPVVVCIYHAVHENDIRAVMRSPYGCVCTDGIVGASPHPRMYGSFVRFLARYVRDQGLMPLEAAINKITAEPARRLRLWDRGLIREGMSADLVLFDYQKLLDLGTYEQPARFPRGMRRVWVQGQLRVCRDAD
jgi:N-acyl-D-amino-acid deacylase